MIRLASTLLLLPLAAAAQVPALSLERAVQHLGQDGYRFLRKVDHELPDSAGAKLDRERAHMARGAAPGVVMLRVEQMLDEEAGQESDPNALMQEFRNQKKSQAPPSEARPKLPPRPQMSVGSGFVRELGARSVLIVTNAHVVHKARDGRVQVLFHDGTQRSGRVLGEHVLYDLALVAVDEGCGDCVALPVGDAAALEVGHEVAALGAPFGLRKTSTWGHINAFRELPRETVKEFIQVSAPINPGNSGGPLVDRLGRVIGVNTQILSPDGSWVGLGFAVPIAYVEKLVARFHESGGADGGGVVVPARIKIVIEARANGTMVVSRVAPGGPAEKGGLRPGDELLAVDGTPAPGTTAGLMGVIMDKIPGRTVELTIRRDGRVMTLSVVPERAE